MVDVQLQSLVSSKTPTSTAIPSQGKTALKDYDNAISIGTFFYVLANGSRSGLMVKILI